MLLPFLMLLMNSFVGEAQQQKSGILFWSIPESELLKAVHRVPITDRDRYDRLRDFFEDAGNPVGQIDQQPVDSYGRRNLIGTLPGPDEKILVVTAHYERSGKGAAAVDDWSGAVMLALLYKSLSAQPQKHQIIFAELDGKQRQKAFLRGLGARRKKIGAVLAMDGLGLSEPSFYIFPQGHGVKSYLAEANLTLLLRKSAEMLRSENLLQFVDCRKAMRIDDSQGFRALGIPSITLHSFTPSVANLAGSAADVSAMIRDDDYYASYKLLCTYVSYVTLRLGELEMDAGMWQID